ncbi:MAG: response regulator [Acidobacteriia bacterium]|nr:response regulator [Terriglobia bacterium]
MADSYSFLDAKQQLENEMTDRQKRLINIRTAQHRYESSAAEEELLENEIEDRKIALERLEAQTCCDCCRTQVDVRETFRIRMSKYSEKSPTINLMVEKVLVRLECAECVRREYDSQQRPERIATKDEIEQAFEMLTPAERRELRNSADYRVHGLGRAGRGRTGEDLLQEALLSTWTGAEDAGKGRHWKKSRVDFIGYLKGAMRRISWGWKEKFSEREPWLESEVIISNPEADEMSPFENVASSEPAADQCLSVKEEIERRFKIFANDKEAIAVLQARLEGMTTAREIMQEHNLTKRHYEAALKQIRCQKSALVIEEHDQVGRLVERLLKQMGYAVCTTCDSGEGLRLYWECSPFDVVMISYSPNLNGVGLATDIFKKNPTQRMIITTTYSSEEEVVRPSQLIHIPILLKPFGRSELRTVLQSSTNTVREKPANCFRPERRRATAIRLRLPLPDTRASRLPKPKRTLNAPPPI